MKKTQLAVLLVPSLFIAGVLAVGAGPLANAADPPATKAKAESAEDLEERGSDHFRASRFAESVADFDREIALDAGLGGRYSGLRCPARARRRTLARNGP